MTVEPGFGGQEFIAEVLPKVRRARELVDTGHLTLLVEVDGGINADTIEAAAEAGADVFVAGLRGLRRRRPGHGPSPRCAPRPPRRYRVSVSPAESRASVSAHESSAMARARELGAARARHDQPQPAGRRGRPRGRTARRWGRGRPRRPAVRTPRSTALAQAGERARGGTVVVTLEPCAHTGRTGPCAEALIAAGVGARRRRRPRADRARRRRGRRGCARPASTSCRASSRPRPRAGALAGWLTGVHERRPFVVWKVAATLDGRVAAADGSSRWITGEQARAAVHRLRADLRRRRRRLGHRAGRRPAADRPRRRRRGTPRGSRSAWSCDRRGRVPPDRPRPRRRRPHACESRHGSGRAAGRVVRPRRPPRAARGRARSWPRPSSAPASSTRSCCTRPRSCSARVPPSWGTWEFPRSPTR